MRPLSHAPQSWLAAGLITGVITLGACNADSAPSDAIVVSDSSGVSIVTNDLPRLTATCSLGSTPTLSIGTLDGGEEYELASVGAARRLSDGRIALSNQGSWQLRLYGADGSYITSSGRQGEGPGEFREPLAVEVLPGDTIYVSDHRPWRYLVFAPDGRYLRTIEPAPMMPNVPGASGVLDDGRFVFAIRDLSIFNRTTPEFQYETRAVELRAADGAFVDTITVMRHARTGKVFPQGNFTTMPVFESYSHLQADADQIVMGHGAEREVKVHGVGAGIPLVRVIRWTGGSREVSSADLAAERARLKQALDAMGPNPPQYAKESYDSEVSDKRPVAEVMPAMNGIRIGSDGRIWVREYPVPIDTGPRSWLGFTKEGRFDCRLATPNFASFHEFGRDYLLVTEQDSLGVERVRQYPLTKK